LVGKPISGSARSILVKSLSYGILLFFVLMCAYFNYRTKSLFLQPNNILNILQQTAINTIIAVGMTFVIISGGIDLSVGSIVALAGVVSMDVLLRIGFKSVVPAEVPRYGLLIAVPFAAVVAMAVGAASGAFSGVFITRLRVTPFIATLAVMSIARGYAFVFTDARPVSPLPMTFFQVVGGNCIKIPGLPAIPPLVPLALLVVLVGHFVLTKTGFGRRVYAIGGNQEAARLSGINIANNKLAIYTICGMLAGLSGFMLSAWTAAGDPKAGYMFEMNAIAAVVLGGTSLMGGMGSITGTLLGALVIGALGIGLDLCHVSTYYQMMVKGGVILLAVVLDQLKVRLSSQA
jgi:ribose/xylose/arabinose/galactoside ABC-type transport system permease subunit